jgi:dolichol-phosphate mannosyltransferase
MKESVFVSVVAYMHNEEKRVSNFLKTIDAFLHEKFETYEIILVNDFSTDQTLANVRATIKAVNGNVIIVDLSRKHGLEQAMMSGLERSVGDFVFEFDSAIVDYPIDTVNEVYQVATTGGYDIVSASTSKKPPISSRVFYRLINKISYLDLDLSTESFRLVTRRALNAMLNLKEKVKYRKALYAFTGYAKTKVQYQPTSNVVRPGKKFGNENINLAISVIVSFSDFGLKLAHYIAMLFLAISVFMIGYALFMYFFKQAIVEGWTSLMILVAFGFSGRGFVKKCVKSI